ncbi:MAG TPA: hypothetical protein VHJ20_12270 [Polyangia bacterium]|nr:hypothetical protein [Polyangia bacterium]
MQSAAPAVSLAPPEDVASHTTAADRFVRAAHLPAAYSPWRHIRLTLTIAAAISAVAAALASRARPLDWALMPIFFVVANFMEWAVHRYPMHRPMRMTPRIMYKNHAMLHHIAFTDRNMPIAEPRELGLVMMPWYTMLGLFVVASPVMIGAAALRGPGLAGVFLLAAALYFLAYETTHALYHLPEATLDHIGLGRSAVFRRMRAHHAHHHVLKRMSAVNFNVTVPLMDTIFRTKEKG